MKQFDPDKTALLLTAFLSDTFRSAGFADGVIGVSGGVDSATACLLAVRALGADHVYPVLMPYGALSTQDTLDAMTFVQSAGIPIAHITRIDIKPAVDRLAEATGAADQVRRGNIMARMRMICLFDQAKKRRALVVGTENRTEHLLGYFTRFGDEASDVEPLRTLYKTQVYELAGHLGVPDAVRSKPPSARLWPEQTDEGEFGFSYTEADDILSLWQDEHLPPERIAEKGHDRQVIDRVIGRAEANAFKHELPSVPKR